MRGAGGAEVAQGAAVSAPEDRPVCGECGGPMVPTIGEPSRLVCLAGCDGIAAMLEAAASVPSSKGRIVPTRIPPIAIRKVLI